MIDPRFITKYDRTKPELEELLLFCVTAISNNAMSSAKSLELFLNELRRRINRSKASPFAAIRRWCRRQRSPVDELRFVMQSVGIGKHGMKSKTFYELSHGHLDLFECTPEQLEAVHGIGFKTSRFFILHSRKDAKCAVLDTHILAYMRDQGFDVPMSTPTGKSNWRKYRDAEQLFIDHARSLNRPIAEFDLSIWNEYSGHLKKLKVGV